MKWLLPGYWRNITDAPLSFYNRLPAIKTKTPDIVMNGVMWEIKSPTGNSKKSTVEYQFKGLKQSRNLIIDGRRTKLSDTFIKRQITLEITRHSRVGRIIFITKSDKIVELP